MPPHLATKYWACESACWVDIFVTETHIILYNMYVFTYYIRSRIEEDKSKHQKYVNVNVHW